MHMQILPCTPNLRGISIFMKTLQNKSCSEPSK